MLHYSRDNCYVSSATLPAIPLASSSRLALSQRALALPLQIVAQVMARQIGYVPQEACQSCAGPFNF
jgi:hypothetical protein